MSGYPHGLTANRTGGGMTLQEAVKTLLDAAWTPEEVEVEYVAMRFERALRAAYHQGRIDGDYDPERGVTAGVAAMVEKS